MGKKYFPPLYCRQRTGRQTHRPFGKATENIIKKDKGCWEWQRPRLFCTTEDLFTQSFVIPYIIPMLENAGAIVYTPRERDWQRNEVIVDNDTHPQGCIYQEIKKPER